MPFSVPFPDKNTRRLLQHRTDDEKSDKTGANLKLFGSCTEVRGLKYLSLLEGTELSAIAELTNWVVDSDKLITF
ncbi:MAG: hypothetical protein ACLFPH_02075 [Bacteroidales bacterium]